MSNQATFQKFVSFATVCGFANDPSAPAPGTEDEFARLTRGDVVIEVQDRGGRGLVLQGFRVIQVDGHTDPRPANVGRLILNDGTSWPFVFNFLFRVATFGDSSNLANQLKAGV